MNPVTLTIQSDGAPDYEVQVQPVQGSPMDRLLKSIKLLGAEGMQQMRSMSDEELQARWQVQKALMDAMTSEELHSMYEAHNAKVDLEWEEYLLTHPEEAGPR